MKKNNSGLPARDEKTIMDSNMKWANRDFERADVDLRIPLSSHGAVSRRELFAARGSAAP
jgi:hypothetical protein